MRKIWACVFFCVLLAAINFAIAADELFYVDELILDMQLKSNFSLLAEKSSSRVDYASAYLHFFPEDDYRQDVVSLETEPDSEIEDRAITYSWRKPGFGNFDYGFSARIISTNEPITIKEKIGFPLKDIPNSVLEFLEPTEKIDITPEIIAQASEIASGEDDLAKVVFDLAAWTKDNINYSLDTFTADASQKSSWVLANRYGVCDELTNLFIAMNRALGIPARFVSGIAYTNSDFFADEWGLHGWAEVYFPGYGWVPVDPTYGQFGYVDATHIKLRDSIDSDKSSTRFEWESYGVDLLPGKMENEIKVIKKGNVAEPDIEMEIIPYSREVSFGSYNLVEVEMTNLLDSYTGFELSLGKPLELGIIGGRDINVLLKPGEKKSAYFILSVNEDLMKNYIYTFPLSAKNSLGGTSEATFRSKSSGGTTYSLQQARAILDALVEEEQKSYSKNIGLACSFPEIIYANESNALECKLENKGNTFIKGIRVCMDNKDCIQEDLGISQSKNLSFLVTMPVPGETQIMVSARNREVSRFAAIKSLVLDKPSVSILNIAHPGTIDMNEEFTVRFDVSKSSESKPENATVIFSINGEETRWAADLGNTQGFEIKIERNMFEPKSNAFEIKVIFHDMNNNEFSEIYRKDLELLNLTLMQRLEIYINSFSRSIERLILG